ncbi:methionine synthase [Amylibacter sp. SFDW26]|uniref:methionine synthase n=1 Tax=Amylibacter sp. SFDW26 TaxID=2652722 RepID=UPI0012625986|nr:methionine synthase [Amylibacter sp. SFDW26]KAB7615653.1 methionine synthase [Amylibacter sp. SFDW26]
MKILSIIFFILAAIVLGLWAFFYIYVMGMACAFGSVNSTNCSVKYPWMLSGEDFNLLVTTPAIIFGLTLVLAILFRREAKKGNDS